MSASTASSASAPVAERDYFTATQIDRGSDFSSGQLWLYLGGLGIELVVLGAAAAGRPVAIRSALARAGRRPLLGAAAAGAGLSIAVAVASLPVGLAAHDRAVDFGLSTQGTASWLGDAGKSIAIGGVLAAAGGALLVAL